MTTGLAGVCRGWTAKGRRCTAVPVAGHTYCHLHDPARHAPLVGGPLDGRTVKLGDVGGTQWPKSLGVATGHHAYYVDGQGKPQRIGKSTSSAIAGEYRLVPSCLHNGTRYLWSFQTKWHFNTPEHQASAKE